MIEDKQINIANCNHNHELTIFNYRVEQDLNRKCKTKLKSYINSYLYNV